jgi:uncharacterized protein (TIGR00299 family) protein
VDVAVTVTLNDRARKMDTLYFDCFNGAGGDMIVAALLDAGVDAARLEHDLGLLGVEGYRLAIEKIQKQGFAATRFLVNAETDGQPHRHLRDIRAILDASRLPERVRARATTAFERLANAEARAHGVALEAVHFHEVGAIDAIVDVVSAMLALEQLQPRRVLCSPLPVGSGTVQCAHGTMPVPAPATALLLTGVPIAATEETGELLTPTAAAILTTVCDSFGALPAMTISAVGMGAGTRDGVHRPNLLRVLGGTATEADAASAESDTVTVLAANIDDTPGEWTGYCLTRLLEAGARDAFCVPISMKKQRPGVVLTVICDSADVARLEAIMFAETSTFGIRRYVAQRSKLAREHETVATPFGAIRVKLGRRGDTLVQVAPEYDDCVAAARAHGVALRQVMAAARQAWSEQSAD